MIIMQVDTNKLMDEVRVAFLSTDCYYVDEERYNMNPQLYATPNVNYVVYNGDEEQQPYVNISQRFNMSRQVGSSKAKDIIVDLKLNRLFTLHNFFDGYVWFYYHVEYFNKGDDQPIGGAATTTFLPIKMKIHKENGRWKVVQVWERP